VFVSESVLIYGKLSFGVFTIRNVESNKFCQVFRLLIRRGVIYS